MNEIQKLELHYKDYFIRGYRAGSGEHAVLLLHGAGMDSAMLSYREVMGILSERYTVYAYDQLGYGESDVATETMSVELNVSVLQSVVAQLGLTDFTLAGLSMGGAVGLGYVLSGDCPPKALIAIDSWGLISKMPMHALNRWYVNTFSTPAQYRFLGRHRGLLKWSLSYALFGDKSIITEQLLSDLTELCKDEKAGLAMQDFQRSSIGKRGVLPDYAARLSEIALPVLFVNGERDPGVPARVARAAAGKVQNGSYYELAGCRHWAQKERPEEFCRVAVEFIEKNRA